MTVLVRALGIDPGTKSFDLCGLEGDKVVYERVVDTSEIANQPRALIKAVEDGMPFDIIAGPSGYGVEVTYLRDVPAERLEGWYLTYILLLKREDMERALREGNIGIMVYYAMVRTAVEMKRRGWPVVYIPGVIHLPTVPAHRKVNKVDMGTADKMCIAVLGVYDQARALGIPYSDVSFVLVEMGFGYNAVIGVDKGRIVDGIGGTLGGPGFLTLGRVDAEIAQLIGVWEKADMFTGGGISISGRKDPEELADCVDDDEMCKLAWEAMIEEVAKNVAAVMVSVKKPKEILISGRLTRIKRFEREIFDRLAEFGEVRRIGSLEGARRVKEAAQGYAIVAEGLGGGIFRKLVDWMRIKEAKGTVLDYVFHEKIGPVKRLFEESKIR